MQNSWLSGYNGKMNHCTLFAVIHFIGFDSLYGPDSVTIGILM